MDAAAKFPNLVFLTDLQTTQAVLNREAPAASEAERLAVWRVAGYLLGAQWDKFRPNVPPAGDPLPPMAQDEAKKLMDKVVEELATAQPFPPEAAGVHSLGHQSGRLAQFLLVDLAASLG